MLAGAELEILVWGGRIAYIYIYLVNYIFIYTFITQLHIDIFTHTRVCSRELLFKYCQPQTLHILNVVFFHLTFYD